jgi:hypothetical protein
MQPGTLRVNPTTISGKTVRGVYKDDQWWVIVFTDGTYSAVEATTDWEDRAELTTRHEVPPFILRPFDIQG